jgi:hypothetical protein
MGYSSKLVLNLDPNPQLGPEKILLPTRINPLSHNPSQNLRMTRIKTAIGGGVRFHPQLQTPNHNQNRRNKKRRKRNWLALTLL